MLTSRAATDAERHRRESSSEDKMIMWKVMVPLVHPNDAMFVLRLFLPRNRFSDLSS